MERPAIRSHCCCLATTHAHAKAAIPLLSGLAGRGQDFLGMDKK